MAAGGGGGGGGGSAEGKAEERLPPGFRFHPTDEELITYYLKNKITEENFSARAIAEADLNKCEPWDLPAKAKMGEKEWYFFSLRDRKYPTGVRTNRATSAGYWKTTGKDREIFNSNGSISTTAELVIGMKKTLVFYKGRAPRGEKTNWVMHEYRLHSMSVYKGNKDGWVVCRIFMKNSSGKKFSSSQTRSSNPHYHLDMASVAAFGPPLLPANHFSGGNYFGIGCCDLMVDLPRFPRPSHAGLINFSAADLPQLNYPGGGGRFALSGLNLNFRAPTQPLPPQPGAAAALRPTIPVPLTSQQQGAAQQQLHPNCFMEVDGGYQGTETGMELEGSDWPQYWKDYQ